MSRNPRLAESSHDRRAPRLSRLTTLDRSVRRGVRLWKVTTSKPSRSFLSENRPMRGSPMVPVPMIWTTFLEAIAVSEFVGQQLPPSPQNISFPSGAVNAGHSHHPARPHIPSARGFLDS